jgi:hypothetical protein
VPIFHRILGGLLVVFKSFIHSKYHNLIHRLRNLNDKIIVLCFMIVAFFGSFYSLFLRNFQENLDDKVNFFLASLPNSRTYLEQQLKSAGDDSVYGFWRIGLSDNYPMLKVFFLTFRETTNADFSSLRIILVTSSSFLLVISLLATLWFGYVLIKSKFNYRFNLALMVFIGSVLFATGCTFLGEIMKNRLTSLGIVGLDTAPYGLSVLGTLMSAGLDLSFIGSTPRGSALLCIMAMWVALLGGQTRLAIISAVFASIIHISYGVIGIALLFLFLTFNKTSFNLKASIQLFLLLAYVQTLIIFYKPPGYITYSIIIFSCYLMYFSSKNLHIPKNNHASIVEIGIYIVYLGAAIFKIILLPEIGLVQILEKILGFREGWALFMTDFPRRIALITAPLVVTTLSYKRLYPIAQKYRKIVNYSAVSALVIITMIFSFTIFTTGFPISKSVYNLDVGSATYYIEMIRMILAN